MSNITSYKDLLDERQRLKLLLYEREIEVKTEFAHLKTKLKPISHIIDFAEKLTRKDRHNPMVTAGIDLGIDFLLKKVLLRNAGWIVKVVGPLFVRNYLSHEVAEKAPWIRKVETFLKRKLSSFS
jgi:hypothetical protein